jgi:Ser/Thr protein kinase RdoA (MazF antagonist)
MRGDKMEKEILEIANCFDITGVCASAEMITDGNINRTYRLRTVENGESFFYLLQKINTFVFRNPDELMQNIVSVTDFLKEKIRAFGGDESRETLTVIPAKDGKAYYTADNGECWRCYVYITDAHTCNSIESADAFFEAGRAFGTFQKLLADYPSETLFDTIPDFHNTYKRYLAFEKAVEDDRAKRAADVESEIDFIRRRRNDTGVLTELIEKNELPLRVTHNDTKLNNVLFDEKTGEGICIIDLDTVMCGLSLYDFGDGVRFGASAAAEDERDLSLVSFDLNLFEAFARGYLQTAGDALTQKEKSLLAFSAKLMTLELAMRFLTDYLNGDEYFKIDYPDHNLVRTRNQIRLVEDIEQKLGKMQEIIERL